MTKTDIKHKAQDDLLHYATTAFYALDDASHMSDYEKAVHREEMKKQLARIEKLFGYIPGSTGTV